MQVLLATLPHCYLTLRLSSVTSSASRRAVPLSVPTIKKHLPVHHERHPKKSFIRRPVFPFGSRRCAFKRHTDLYQWLSQIYPPLRMETIPPTAPEAVKVRHSQYPHTKSLHTYVFHPERHHHAHTALAAAASSRKAFCNALSSCRRSARRRPSSSAPSSTSSLCATSRVPSTVGTTTMESGDED